MRNRKLSFCFVFLFIFSFAPAGSAHQPHDSFNRVKLSPGFASDGIVLALRDEIYTLYKSIDAGKSYFIPPHPLTTKKLTSVEFSPAFSTDNTVFAGTEDEGFFISTDAGENWMQSNEGLDRLHITAIGVSPYYATNQTIFAGTADGFVYKSVNGGGTWTEIASSGKKINDIDFAQYQSFEDIIYIAVYGGGVFRSIDGGTGWIRLIKGLRNQNITQLAVSPGFQSDTTLFVSTFGGGIYRSNNGGAYWTQVNNGITDLNLTDIEISSTKEIFAISAGGGVYSSDNYGVSWSSINNGLPLLSEQTKFHNRDIAVSNGFADDKTVFLAMFEGVYKTGTAGLAWSETNVLPVTENRHVAISPDFPLDRTFMAGTLGGGLLKTEDKGETWDILNKGLFNTYLDPVKISPDYASDKTIFLGTTVGLVKSTDNGTSWALFSLDPEQILYVRELEVSPNYGSDRVLFAATETADGLYKSIDGGVTWTSSNIGLPAGNRIRSIAVPGNYEETENPVLFIGLEGKGVYKSIDGGSTWFSANLGIEELTVESIAVSPSFAADSTLFIAATAVNGIYKSMDAGSTWNPVATGLDYNYYNAIAVSPAYESDGTVIFSAYQGGVYKSTDNGGTWMNISNGILPQLVRDIVFSPGYREDQTLFLGTSGGVFRSFDGGESWTKIQNINRYENHPDLMLFSGFWQKKYSDMLSGRNIEYSSQPESYCEFSFNGSSIDWIASKGPTHGIASVYVDELFVADIDLYEPEYHFYVSAFKGDVEPGWHTMKIQVTGSRNPASTNSIITLDAVDIRE